MDVYVLANLESVKWLKKFFFLCNGCDKINYFRIDIFFNFPESGFI